jgi:hypothetical protein
MHGRKTASGLAALAVGGAIVLGGCGGDSTTESRNASAPAGAAMKGKDDATKGEDQAMNGHHQAMKGDDDAMKGEKAMHEKGAGHDEAMHEG